uniref:Small ribosomal subunit protein uS19c n=1 Tax=Nitzschia putrida TaxID=2742595 RepID=A0A7R7TRE4_9STRA|nr:ribosomal protein S19 [Nitzschia putrida]
MIKSSKKNPFIAYYLLKKIIKAKKLKENKIILTWSRSSTILPFMVGYTIGVYNGKQHIPIYISNKLIGHKLGEFVTTRKFRTHNKLDKKKTKK